MKYWKEPVSYTHLNGLLERGLNFVLDDKHHGLKARAPRIKDGIVNNQLAVAAHRVYLLQACLLYTSRCV